LTWQAGEPTAEALREHAALVADEVLAVEMHEAALASDGAVVRDEVLDLFFTVAKA